MLSYSTAQKEEVDQSGHHGQGNSSRRKVPNELFSNCGLLGGAGLSGLQDEPNLTGFSRTSRAKAHCLASSFAALEALRHWSRWSSWSAWLRWFLVLIYLRPPRTTLLPYTTLFR